jgi:DNA-directed RNA polymerase subunit RPC12/RpoP
MICGNCKHIVHWEQFTGDTPIKPYPKKCPHCGNKFKKGMTVQ